MMKQNIGIRRKRWGWRNKDNSRMRGRGGGGIRGKDDGPGN